MQFVLWRTVVFVLCQQFPKRLIRIVITGEPVVHHVAADIHLTVEEGDVRQEMPYITYKILHPPISHGIPFPGRKTFLHHIGAACRTEMRCHAGLDPVRTLGAVSNESVTGDVDSRTVKGIDRIPSAFLNIGQASEGKDVLLVSLADADVATDSDNGSYLVLATDRVRMLLFSLRIVDIAVSLPFFFKRLLVVCDAITENITRIPAPKLHSDEREKHVNGAHVVKGVLRTASLGGIKELLCSQIGGGNHVGDRS